MFVNTDLFREKALFFLKHGYYTDAPEGTKSYNDFWAEEYKRIKEGYSVGGVRITGSHYWYLNYCQILRTKDTYDITGKKGQTKEQSFPAFWDGDYNYFWAVEIGRFGVTPEEYKALNLDLNIPVNQLNGGRHLVVLKARGKGFSYKAGSMLSRMFNTSRKAKAFAMAFEKEYLIKDGVLNKAWDNISFVDKHTPFRQPRLIDTMMHKQSGYKRNIGGTDVILGTQNEIMGVSLKDDPDKARGKRGELIFFEEAGKFPGLLKAWEVSKSSVEQGAITTGMMIAYGTGGTDDADYAGVEELFFNPEGYNVLAMENIWDEGASGTYSSFFFPTQLCWEGFIDKDGNSDLDGAAQYHLEQRELRKKSPDANALAQYICENPFNPREATLRVSTNSFPILELRAQLDSVKAHKRYHAGTPGVLYSTTAGEIKLKVSDDAKPVWDYPVKKDSDNKGCIVVYEAPFKDDDGKIPNGMYLIGHDPFAHDNTVGGSLGAAYVIKRSNRLSQTLSEGIVASYVGKPASQDEYNQQLYLLAEYYGCKIGFENNRGEVIPYGKRFKKLHLLEEEFEMLDKRELQSRTTRRAYGMHMTEQRKAQGEVYIRDWLNSPVQYFDDGTVKLQLHTILDPGLLEELIRFHQKGNFDRVMALMLCMYYTKEMHNAEVTLKSAPLYEEFFNRVFFQ